MIFGTITQVELKDMIVNHQIKRKLVVVEDCCLELVYKAHNINLWYINRWTKKENDSTVRRCTLVGEPEYVDALYRYVDNVMSLRKDKELTHKLIMRSGKAAMNERLPLETRKWYAQRAYAMEFMLKDARI